MSLSEEIRNNASNTFSTAWSTRDGREVPSPNSLKMGNDAIRFERATVLYADLDQSTALVEKKRWDFAAEVYKTYLYAASRLIRDAGGVIVSYDGDRVMGIFIGNRQSNDAVRCALKINYGVKTIVQGELKKFYTSSDYTIKHVVGIDTSETRAARTGVRGDNDLVWVGNAANLAAKLTGLDAEQPTYITNRTYKLLDDNLKVSAGKEMWRRWRWSKHNDDTIYSTSYHIKF